MNVTLRDPRLDRPGQSHLGFVDCDVHPMVKSGADFDPFLAARWIEHRKTIGGRSRQGLARAATYPRMSPGVGQRMDAWPKDGSLPGSDLGLLREQLLDLFDVSHGLLAPLVGGHTAERNVDFAAAMATAVNEWQLARFCVPEPRLKAAVQITMEHEQSAIAEIEHRAGDRRFVQTNIPPRGIEPLGRHRYRRILAASAAAGLPISLHLGGTSGHPSTGGGWPSFYHEEHPSYVQTMQTLVTSLVCEGVFEEIPDLKVVLVEGGFAWLPALCWRLDKHWKRLKAEVPSLTKAPSEYIREHFWVTTQPIEEPERPADMLSLIEWIGPDRIMFSTDYPHWDQDDPRYAFKVKLPDDWSRMIYRDNAKALYHLA
ncbi:MAG: amidohydrolase family protein [Alphaproteobacteria bacterium]|nr:amidohydrolase family protein [Alphaproteobacteria bacterium]